MRTPAIITLSLFALAACSPDLPNSGVSATPATTESDPGGPGAATGAARALGIADPSAASPDPRAVSATGAPLSAMSDDAATSSIAADPAATAAISDEQSFQAVSARETIASDAERIDTNRAQYVTIEPTQLPPRPDGSGASIVAYALATTNAPGQSLFRRSGIAAQARFDRSCAKYGGADKAQEAFLDAGGPKRDRLGMDPDGDGFACFWDPRPFRAAQGGAPEIVEQYEVIETPGES